MRTITNSFLLTYLALRVSKGSLVRRVSEGVLCALFVLSTRCRSSASRNRREDPIENQSGATTIDCFG